MFQHVLAALALKLKELNPQFHTWYARKFGDATEDYYGQDGAIDDVWKFGAYFLFDQHIDWKDAPQRESCVQTRNGETVLKLIAWGRSNIDAFRLEERMRESLELMRQDAQSIILGIPNYYKLSFDILESNFDAKEIIKAELFGSDKLPANMAVIQISFRIKLQWTLTCKTDICP